MRVLVTGWPGPIHGEATAGDVLAMEAVAGALAAAGVDHRLAWSDVMSPTRTGPTDVALSTVAPGSFSHLVWVCGPLHGSVPARVAKWVGAEVSLAVGVSVVEAADEAVAAYGEVLARDGGGVTVPDLAHAAPAPVLPQGGDPSGPVAVILTRGQAEYGARRRHDAVAAAVTSWLDRRGHEVAVLDTRLDPRDPALASTPAEVEARLAGCRAVVTTRMHGLVHAVRLGLPVVAVDPVVGGAKVSAQACAVGLTALAADAVVARPDPLDRALDDALAGAPSHAAAARRGRRGAERQVAALVDLIARPPRRVRPPS